MLCDLENNKVKLENCPNAHLLLIGKSGTGKTFCCCRRMEEAIRKGEKVLIVDYAGSYQENELKKINSST